MRFSVKSTLTAALLASTSLACRKGSHTRSSSPTTLATSYVAAPPTTSSSSTSIAVTPTVVASSAPEETLTTEVVMPTPATAVVKPTKSSSTTSATTAAATTSAAASSSSLTADQQAALDAHNAARAEVGETALTWDADLAAGAQEWADHLVSLGVGSLVHSGADGLGENLYWQSNSDTPYTNAATAWIDEKSVYSGEAIGDGDFEAYGHYTQIIWDTTTKVGMAIATDSSGGIYVVARYTPQGNYVGETPTA